MFGIGVVELLVFGAGFVLVTVVAGLVLAYVLKSSKRS